MHDLGRFGVGDLEQFSAALRTICTGRRSMEDAAQRIVGHLRAEVYADAEPAVALARLYKTHPYRGLDAQLQAFARDLSGQDIEPSTPCLTLLATAGIAPAWNDRSRSRGHAAIALANEGGVARLPMIAALLAGLGVGLDEVLEAKPFQMHHHRHHGVFFVEDAADHPAIPAQDDFVRLYGIKSVIGVGGFLPSGDVFALILFLTTRVSSEVAMLFGTASLSLKAALIPYTYRPFTTSTT